MFKLIKCKVNNIVFIISKDNFFFVIGTVQSNLSC